MAELSHFVILFTCLSYILALHAQPQVLFDSHREIHVNPLHGDDAKCQQGVVPCKTLEQANRLLNQHRHNVTITIDSNATLHGVFEVIDSSNIHIQGSTDAEETIYVTCEPGVDAGFAVNNTKNFTFSHLAVPNCSAPNREIHFSRLAMLVNSSRNVSFMHARFEHCSYTALSLANNSGRVSIVSTSFLYNMRYTHLRRNQTVNTSYPAALAIQLHNVYRALYTITECTFLNNESPKSPTKPVYSETDQQTYFEYRGFGGGMFLEFGGNTSKSSVIIQSCSFASNRARRGGGIYALYKDASSNNSFLILDSNFTGNNADISGGGVNFGHYNAPSNNNTILIFDCNFTNNSALYGGGLTVYSSYAKENFQDESVVIVNNSIWYSNWGVLAPAVDIAPLFDGDESEGYLPTPVFNNCMFEGNFINNTPYGENRTSHINTGVFAVTKFTVLFQNKTEFKTNKFSAISLVSATIEFQNGSNVTFNGNLGFDGGAIAMYSFSSLIFNPHSTVNFSNNNAINNGGAIYYRPSDQHNFLPGAIQCFLKNNYPSLANTTNVVFENNSAEIGGSSIYSVSFQGCFSRCKKMLSDKDDAYKITVSNTFKCVGNFSYQNTENNTQPLTSSGSAFKFHESWSHTYSVFPGQNFSLNFSVIDDFNHTVHPLMSITKVIQNKHKCNDLWVQNTYTIDNSTVIRGKSGTTAQLAVSVIGVRQIYFFLDVSLLPCPPGFHNMNGMCACASGNEGYNFIVKCDDFHAKYDNSMWFGYKDPDEESHGSDDHDLYFAPCAAPLCNEDVHKLPKYHDHLSKKLCFHNRTGILCGSCTTGYSTYYHSRSFACRDNGHCRLGVLYYILSEIIPMIMFFLVIVIFELSFTSGKMVGFIFFTQYLNQLTIHVSEKFTYLRSPYRIFYGLFNFEFFNIEQLSFCLWQGAQILDVIAVKYVTVLTALGLMLLFIVLVNKNCCTALCRLRKRVSTKTSVVHGLSAFLVICYAQCTRTSFYILKVTHLTGYNNSRGHYHTYYGGLRYFHKQHLLYAVPALISMVFVTAIPPLILLLYPLSLHLVSFCGLSEHWMVNKTLRLTCIFKLQPFIDCFQSCYKDKLRFFAGLYFVYRVIIMCVFSMSPDSFHFSVYSEVLILILLGIHAVVQPYKRRLHNVIDALILSNLALINGCLIIIRLYMNQVNYSDDKSYTDKTIIMISAFQLLLLYLPMIVLFFVLGRMMSCRMLLGAKILCCKKQENAVPVHDILEHDSDRTSLLSSSSVTMETSSYKSLDTY